ncbi:DNA repair ATPase [Levilactobacillus namurensis DSM 19117]|uniref:Nuclease SbcCD subunit C n=1 Tax=Levilactobacillus namurensis DSM 19117 TaxID=1423773 RepID=A0A0R1K8W7_9LACO|nr:SMC family ATPase [Levilactobacillus namurensis]KRK76322.1 DNA repair ATPase [Levilactobacillus namurensis DSM 19117]GEO73657.1 nuclease SbcCD subunit C [Levilactobacillus namurensis]
MTPKSLHLEFFGPYRDTVIDFTQFSGTPLFLISGKTGSGKTTIFDGMCYALFDQTSGADRRPQAMRSDFATFADTTRVTFVFTQRDRRYEIVREPAQTLQKKRGTGVTDVAASVTLTVYQDDQEIRQLTKAKQVQEFLQTLLQMNGQQFAQIVLLPQGQFRRFLVAPSDEKATVLEQLFNTEIFARWADQLTEQVKRNRQQNKTALAALTQLQRDLTWDPANQAAAQDLLANRKTQDLLTLMARQQAATKTAEDQATATYQQAQQHEQALTRQDTREEQLVQDQAQLKLTREEQAQLQTQAPAMAQLAAEIQELEWTQQLLPKWRDWQQAQQLVTQRQAAVDQQQRDLATTRTAADQAQNSLDGLASLKAKLAKWQEEQAQNARIRPLYQQIEQTQTDLAVARKKATAAQQAWTTVTHNVQQNTDQQAQQQQIIAPQDHLVTQRQTLQQTANTLATWTDQAQRLQRQAESVARQEHQLAALKTQVATAQQAAQEAQQTADELYQVRLRHQIAELSAQLTPGSPCPVCGATDHPQPAATTVADADVSTKRVKAAQDAATQKQQQATTLATQFTQGQTRQTADTQDLHQQVTELRATIQTSDLLVPADDLAGIQEQLATATRENQTALQENARQLAAVKTAKATLEELTAAATQLKQRVETAQAAVHDAQTAVERLAAQLATQQDQLPDRAETFMAFTAREQALAQQVADAQGRCQAAEQAVTQTQERLTVAQTELKTAQTEATQSQHTLQTARTVLDAALTEHQLTLAADREQLEAQVAAVAQLAAKRQTWQTYQSHQERLKATQETLVSRIGNQTAPDRDQTQAALKAAHQQVGQAQDRRYALQESWTHNDRIVTQLTQQLAAQQTAIKQTQALEELAGVINGDGPNTKLGLERYVLQTYLRQILVVGNQRLQQLTNGRYQFVIDDSPAASKKRSGLEIDVYDDHVGEQRSVHTLSGGESFIAALALALALGEVIQQTTGSVDVEALFIDEGFGSLDEDALMTALESLESVEGQHRMIGIISHVSELRAQVPNQLQVISNGNGESHVRYQTESDL